MSWGFRLVAWFGKHWIAIRTRFSRGIWVSAFLVPTELQFYTWLCGFFELAAVLIAFCTYFLECFQCLLMWIVVWLYFARVFRSNSASASLDYQKNAISLSFVEENARTVDANFTRVFACTLTIWMIFLLLSLLNSVQIFVLMRFSTVSLCFWSGSIWHTLRA